MNKRAPNDDSLSAPAVVVVVVVVPSVVAVEESRAKCFLKVKLMKYEMQDLNFVGKQNFTNLISRNLCFRLLF